MARQQAQTGAHSSTEERLAQLRRRMIRETEAFLNERLYGIGKQPADAGAQLNPRDNRYDRRQRPPRAERSIDVRTRPAWGTLIEVHPNQSGMVDDARLQALEFQLRELTDDPAAGDIVIDIEQVAVMSAGFMSLLAIIRPRLICQNRKLTLQGLRPQCAALLEGTGLEDLIEQAILHSAVVALPLLRFDDALTARPRGSGRAA
jgi:anti-anti-sigma regulatory factor